MGGRGLRTGSVDKAPVVEAKVPETSSYPIIDHPVRKCFMGKSMRATDTEVGHSVSSDLDVMFGPGLLRKSLEKSKGLLHK